MNIDLFRHWMPDLKQTKNHNAYVARQCLFCPPTPQSKSFRINTKLKVWKCYQCGKGGKDFNKFFHYLKNRNSHSSFHRHSAKYLKRIGRHPLGFSIEVYYGCETYQDSLLPF